MVGYVCTIAGGKGGVGKTTTAVNVAAALQDAGYDIVVVDADLGMSNLGAMLGVDFETSIHEILGGGVPVRNALTETQGGVTIIPGEQSLEAFADADPANLQNVVKTLRNAYDVVIIDSGAGLSHETTVPLGLADGIIIVTTPDEVAVGDARKTKELAERVDGGEVLGALLTRAKADTDLDEIDARMDMHLLAAIPEDVSATEDEPLVYNSPESPAAEAYKEFSMVLESLFFRATDPSSVETVYDEAWFREGYVAATDEALVDGPDEPTEDETDETESTEETTDEEDADEDETFGLFN
jgi:septum site-determining protein MinD